MKKKIFRSPKYIIAFVLGAIVFSVIGVKAATMLAASEGTYDNSNSSLQATNVQGAIDELYTKAASKEKLCKKGYYTTSNGSSNYTCTKIGDNESVITITANGSGDIQFLSTKYDDTMPDYVSVDGTSITPAKSYNFATGGDHTIVLKWNDSASVTSMYGMFADCTGLTSLDLSNFDTSNVTNIQYIFYKCSSLTSLDLSNFDTSSVTDMSGMFYQCSSLTSLDLSNFDTSSVTDMSGVFYKCSSLTSLDLSSFNTSSVTSMQYMFHYCSSLTSLDLSSFDTSNVTNMKKIFDGCSSLTNLDLSNFNFSSVTDYSSMFEDVPNNIAIKSSSTACSWIAANSGITATNYTCTQQ